MITMYPNIKVKLDEGAMLPQRAHATDAGADIFAPHDVTVPPSSLASTDHPTNATPVKVGCAIVRTGVHVELPPTTVGMLKSKSGLNVKSGIISEGVIDEGYSGEIVVKLYNLTNEPVYLPAGSKITQLCVMPVCYPTFSEVEEINSGARGDAGFGSTETITGGERL